MNSCKLTNTERNKKGLLCRSIACIPCNESRETYKTSREKRLEERNALFQVEIAELKEELKTIKEYLETI